jgi:hypothetical protein
MPLTILRYRGDVFTELLHINDTGIYRQIQTHVCNNPSIVACISCRGNVLTEPLPNKGLRDTHADAQTDGTDL